jgi:sodium-dependent dicarboxylate transporter 2/3/5
VLIIFVIPRTWKFFPFVRKAENVQRSDPLVTWEVVESKLPWGVVLLLGGGFALSEGCTKSGLSNWIAVRLQGLDGLPPAGINLLMSMAAATVTEFVSNTATANILIPILKQFSYSLCLNPVYLGKTLRSSLI